MTQKSLADECGTFLAPFSMRSLNTNGLHGLRKLKNPHKIDSKRLGASARLNWLKPTVYGGTAI